MDRVIIYVIGFFFVLGGIDYVLGSPLRLGGKFEEGLKTMGALGLGMIGIYSLAPVLAKILVATVVPLSRQLGFDPSIFPAALLALDMGGFQLATGTALTKEMGLFSGVVVASSLGATISFSIPVALGMLSSEDQHYFSKGIMIGMLAIPFGCIAGGLLQGIPIGVIAWNLLPVLLFSALLVVGMFKAQKLLMKGFGWFGRLIIALSVAGLLLQGIDALLGIQLVVGMAKLSESAYIVVKISFVLAGAYPMLELINRVFQKNLAKLGGRMGINSAAVAGLLGNLASNLVVFGTFKDMDPKGKVVCTAFGVCGAFVMGGQLGFVSGVAPQMLPAFVLNKLVAGGVAIALALLLYKGETKNKNTNDMTC